MQYRRLADPSERRRLRCCSRARPWADRGHVRRSGVLDRVAAHLTRSLFNSPATMVGMLVVLVFPVSVAYSRLASPRVRHHLHRAARRAVRTRPPTTAVARARRPRHRDHRHPAATQLADSLSTLRAHADRCTSGSPACSPCRWCTGSDGSITWIAASSGTGTTRNRCCATWRRSCDKQPTRRLRSPAWSTKSRSRCDPRSWRPSARSPVRRTLRHPGCHALVPALVLDRPNSTIARLARLVPADPRTLARSRSVDREHLPPG